MENYFCANSVEEQVDYLTDKVKDIITNKLDKASIVQETGTGTDVVMSQKAVTDAIANKGLDTLTGVNLTVGNTTVQYDTTEGIQLTSTGRFTCTDGNHDATIDLALPIVGTDGIVIDKAADSEKIEVSGKNFAKALKSEVGQYKVYASRNGNPNDFLWTGTEVLEDLSLVIRGNNGSIYTNMPDEGFIKDTTVPNKKYVEDNYIKKPDPYVYDILVAMHPNGDMFTKHLDDMGCAPLTVAQVYESNSGDQKPYSNGVLITNDPVQPYQCANKKYVDDAIASIPTTTQTKYQHNLKLEGIKGEFIFKAYLSISRSDEALFNTFDEVVQAIGSLSSPCTGYVYDGTKYYSIYVLDGSAPVFNYLNPDLGEQILEVTNEDVSVTDDVVLEF